MDGVARVSAFSLRPHDPVIFVKPSSSPLERAMFWTNAYRNCRPLHPFVHRPTHISSSVPRIGLFFLFYFLFLLLYCLVRLQPYFLFHLFFFLPPSFGKERIGVLSVSYHVFVMEKYREIVVNAIICVIRVLEWVSSNLDVFYFLLFFFFFAQINSLFLHCQRKISEIVQVRDTNGFINILIFLSSRLSCTYVCYE